MWRCTECNQVESETNESCTNCGAPKATCSVAVTEMKPIPNATTEDIDRSYQTYSGLAFFIAFIMGGLGVYKAWFVKDTGTQSFELLNEFLDTQMYSGLYTDRATMYFVLALIFIVIGVSVDIVHYLKEISESMKKNKL